MKEFRSPHPSSFTLEEQRFIDEAQMIMRLSHKNIVKAIDLPSDAKLSQSIESLYLCMEYCDGGDLRQVSLTVTSSYKGSQPRLDFGHLVNQV